MDVGTYAVVLALVAGTIHALILFRASVGVEVVNVAVLTAIAEGRGSKLRALLRGSGSAPYLDVALTVGNSALELRAHELAPRELRRRLDHDAKVAVIAASRRLRREAWLDYLSLAAILFAAFDVLASPVRASEFTTLGVIAATLLWFANIRGARSIATRAYAGAVALVDGLIASLDRIPQPEKSS
jgi:hypothetical protein